MMDGSRPAAIRGTLVDVKIVRTRSVVQLVTELPIEEANAALETLGGIPIPGKEPWVAIARLNPIPRPAADPLTAGADTPNGAPGRGTKSEAARERYQQLGHLERTVADCAMLCGDPAFQQWLGVETEKDAAAEIRERCGIASRSDLVTNEAARWKWGAIVTDFEIDSGRRAAPR